MVAGRGLPIEDQTIGHRAELSAPSMGLYCLSSFLSYMRLRAAGPLSRSLAVRLVGAWMWGT
eukprot:5941638-Alexandrium_andersonii.AAC.1